MSSKEESYEYGLPEYLQHDLNEYKRALKEGSNLMDCLWSELYGSINVAEMELLRQSTRTICGESIYLAICKNQ